MLEENLLWWEDHCTKCYSFVPPVLLPFHPDLSPRRLTRVDCLNRSHVFWLAFANDQEATGQEDGEVRVFIPPVQCPLLVSIYSACTLVNNPFINFFVVKFFLTYLDWKLTFHSCQDAD